MDSLESDFRPLDFMKEIFKSTPNLNNKEGSVAGVGPGGSPVAGKRSPGGGVGVPGMCPMGSHLNHARSTSYSVSYCMRKATGSPSNIDAKGRFSGLLKISTRAIMLSYFKLLTSTQDTYSGVCARATTSMPNTGGKCTSVPPGILQYVS